MTAKEFELIKAYREYIHFLGKAYDEAFGIANIHGYNCSNEEIQFGQQLRDNIKELEDKCDIDKLLSVVYTITDE
jgi:hypothetical protein